MANGSEVLLGLLLRVITLKNERNKNCIECVFGTPHCLVGDVKITDWLFGIGFGHYFQ